MEVGLAHPEVKADLLLHEAEGRPDPDDPAKATLRGAVAGCGARMRHTSGTVEQLSILPSSLAAVRSWCEVGGAERSSACQSRQRTNYLQEKSLWRTKIRKTLKPVHVGSDHSFYEWWVTLS